MIEIICKRYANRQELQTLMSYFISRTTENKGMTKAVIFL